MLFFLLLLSALYQSPPTESPETPPQTARRLLDSKPEYDELAPANDALTKYIQSNPRDADALILSARMTLQVAIFAPAGKKSEPKTLFDSAQALLDRALTVRPDDAEALYWKGELFRAAAFLDKANLDAALRYARRAAEIAPKEERYQEGLAGILLEQEKAKDALKVLAALRGGKHPTYLLLNDLETFPIPENAVLDRMKTAEYSIDQAERGRIQDNLYLRARLYDVASTAAEIGAFYKKRFAPFALGQPQTTDKKDAIEIAMYVSVFRSTASGWELQQPLPDDPQEGIILGITEIRGDGKTHCALLVQTLRKVAE